MAQNERALPVVYTVYMTRELDVFRSSKTTVDRRVGELTRDWNDDIFYQVYPYTFNEERPPGEAHVGKGSITGIIDKLDYLSNELGVTAIWLGPIYASPGKDGNYDISDYREVNADLGTLEDTEALIAACHERDMRVIFDLVPNHTSDQHEWFKKSCARDPEFEDSYIWANPVPGKLPKNIVAGDRLHGLPEGLTVPNNWSSIFSLPEIEKIKQQYGGVIPDDVDIPAVTAWVWHEGRQQFYLAEFMKEQPSLNWQNPAVREAMKDTMRFWLDKGVDGFRVDVMNHIGKDPSLQDEEIAPIGTGIGKYNKGVTNPHDQWKQERLVSHWPTLEPYAREMIAVLDEYPGTRLIIEDWMAALEQNDQLSKLRPDKATVFNFDWLLISNAHDWQAATHKASFDSYYNRMYSPDMRGSVPNQVNGNHDVDRIVTRIGSEAARTAAVIKLTLPGGTPYIYQGEEGGFPNNDNIPLARQRDREIGMRDGERSPMMWDGSFNAGFSKAPDEQLWLPVDKNFPELHLEQQRDDPTSFFSLYRTLIRLRKTIPALRRGRYLPLQADHPDVLAFGIAIDGEKPFVTLANFSSQTVESAVDAPRSAMAKIAITAQEVLEHGMTSPVRLTGSIPLGPNDAYLLRPTT